MTREPNDDTRFLVLRELSDDPRLSQRDLADRIGISLGGINYCLRALAEKGMVKVVRFRNSDNKRRYAYLMTPRGFAEKSRLTAGFLSRKMAEYEALRAEISALEREIAKDEIRQHDGLSEE